MNSPTTDEQINEYLPGVKIIQYRDLSKYNSFADLCNNPYKACFILYVNNKTPPNTLNGHWNCLMINNDGSLNLFDPYGDFFNDRNLILIGKNRKNFGEEEPLLSNLILNDDSINEIHYNNKPYQEKNGSQTCGKHCIYRVLNRDLNNNEYHKLMNKQKKKLKCSNFDETIVKLIQKT